MNVPQRPQFSFTANNASEHDESGAARWTIPHWTGVNWTTDVLYVDFQCFRDAHAVNGMLDAVWKAGEAAGHAACKAAVLAALEVR